MRKLVIFVLFIAIFTSAINAYCVCLYNGPCGCDDTNPYKDTNMSRYVQYEPKPAVYWARSDEAIGSSGLDTFEDSRPTFQSWEKKIEIEIDANKTCVNEYILIRTWYRSKPLAYAQVKLYSHAGGRTFVSEVTTDENGWAVFGEKPYGKYDFIARKEDYNEGQKIFSVDYCLPKKEKMEVRTDAWRETVFSVVYAKEYERRYIQTQVGGGQTATKVRLDARVDGNKYIIEKIPRTVVEDKSLIGFESFYPQIFEQNKDEIVIGWKIDGAKNQTVFREYVIMRNPAEDTVDDMEFAIVEKYIQAGTKVKSMGIIESILAFFGL